MSGHIFEDVDVAVAEAGGSCNDVDDGDSWVAGGENDRNARVLNNLDGIFSSHQEAV